jgi:hypothetical protein
VIYRYPLQWPVGVRRTANPKRALFDTAEEQVKRNLSQQLYLMKATDAIITTNVEVSQRTGRPYANQRIADAGVSLYFTRKGQQQVIACDKWNTIKDNLHAIGKSIEALRGIERWGTDSMMDAVFTGFAAIPANAGAGAPARPKRLWWDVLEVSPSASRQVVDAAYRAKRRATHPDSGGDAEAFQEVQDAYKEAIR